MNSHIGLLVLFTLILCSCKGALESGDIPHESYVPYGIWIYAGNDEDTRIYYSAPYFKRDQHGISLEEKNVYVERTAGWCLTPPVTYYNVTGTWEVLDDKNLLITCSSCIESTRIMEIIHLSRNELRVKLRSIRE